MRDESDTPLTEEELALARRGEARIAAAVADVRAPQSLREAIERDREGAQAKAPFWRRHRLTLAAAGTAAAALVAVAIALETGSDNADPSLGKVYAAAQLDPTEAAPAPVGGTPPVLDAEVGALEFPDWQEKFGWTAVAAATTSSQAVASPPSSTATPTARDSDTPSSPGNPSVAIPPGARSSTGARRTRSPAATSGRPSPGPSRATPA